MSGEGTGRRLDAGPSATTDDAFLDGALKVLQPKSGFRAGLDSVLLAAAVEAPAKATVFDLGLGAGVASLCLLRRRPDLTVEGLEIDPGLAALARENAARNGFADRLTVHTGDALRLPKDLPRQGFDHVMTNPPFLWTEQATSGPDAGKARAIAIEPEDEADWFKSALALLKPKGALTVIHRADALGRLLSYLTPGTGAVTVLPFYPAQGAAATRILVTAKKGSRAPLTLLAGLVLHAPDGRFTPQIERVLREGVALSTSPS
jgi:tRNA1(Val) A37 N6-methylase TrmN6